ncbi:Uncharacterised protein [Achromobacter xylosoxidans]|nr:Uncharacterised protein [Achromobacter xylosoxidans]
MPAPSSWRTTAPRVTPSWWAASAIPWPKRPCRCKAPRARAPRMRRTRCPAGAACTSCWNASITAWPGGAPRPTRSTGGASSKSTSWLACGSRTTSYSTPCTPCPCACTAKACSTGCVSTTSTAWPRRAPTCAGCARRWPRRRPRVRGPAWPPNPIWSWKRSWPMTSASTRAGPPTAPPAMTSWTRSARCCTRPPRVNRWRNSGRP